jgi:hypothetical protein
MFLLFLVKYIANGTLSGFFIFIFTCYPWTSEIYVRQGPLMFTPGPFRLLYRAPDNFQVQRVITQKNIYNILLINMTQSCQIKQRYTFHLHPVFIE